MFAKSYRSFRELRRKGTSFVALVALIASGFTFLEAPVSASAAIVTNNLVMNLDASNTSSLAATSPTSWTSVSPATSTATSTFFGNAARTSDSTGASMSFDGSADAVVFPAGTGRSAGAMTVDMWIKPANLRMGWNILASRWFNDTARTGAAASNDWHFGLYSDGTSNIKLNLSTTGFIGLSGVNSTTTFPTTSANKWYHVGFTIDPTNNNTATIWVNGVAEASLTGVTHTDNATAQLHIGDVGSTNTTFTGLISRFRIYNSALSSAQMAQNYLADSTNYGYAPANTVAPAITGIAKVGTALSTTGGTWGVGDADGTTTAYQWQTSTDSTNWTNISGATTASYTPVAGDATNYLRVRVTKTNTAGSATATSAATLRVQAAAGVSLVSPGKLTGLTSTVPNDATTYNVTLASSNLSSKLSLGTTTGLTFVGGYASTASYMATSLSNPAPIVSFRGTGTAINTALANITYTSTDKQTDVVKLFYATAGSTDTDTKNYIPIYDNNQLKFHYYAYKSHAASKDRPGMDAALVGLTTTDYVQAPGPWYLVTPRYQVEWDRVKTIGGLNAFFMGALADAGSTNWYWPANTDGYSSATIFGTQSGSTVTATSNVYNQSNTTLPFHTGEPNGGTTVARSGYVYVNNNALGWDDVPSNCACTANFVMETFGTAPFNAGSTGVLAQTVSTVTNSFDPPTGFTVTPTGTGSVLASWDAVTPNTTVNPLAAYKVEYSTSATFSPLSSVTTSSTATSALITGLSANTTYYFRVFGIGGTVGQPWGAASSSVTAATTSTATTITVVASGGGVSGTDYTLVKGYIIPKSGLSVSVNASDIQTSLASTATILAADNIVISTPLTWNVSRSLRLGNSTTSTVAINKSITVAGSSSGLQISPATYSLDVKSGASISFTGTSQTLSIGPNSYTLIKSTAELTNVTATGYFALAKPIAYANNATALTTSPINNIFTGTFDGLGNTIDRLNMSVTTSNWYGLFQRVGAASAVRNLGVTNASIQLGAIGTGYSVGLIAGGSEGAGATIDQVWTTGLIRSAGTTGFIGAGGILGQAYSGSITISKSWSSASIDTSLSGSATQLGQGGIIGADVNNYGQAPGVLGGVVTLNQVYATGTLKWASNAWRGIGGLYGIHYNNTGGATITDSFSWATFSAGVPANNQGGIIGVNDGSNSTLTRVYQTTSSTCANDASVTVSPACPSSVTPGVAIPSISGAAWTSTGATVLANLATPTKPLYVRVVAPTDGSYSTMSYQLVDGAGSEVTLSSLNLTLSGIPTYSLASNASLGTYSVDYVSGLTLGGTNASIYSLNIWPTATSVTLTKNFQTVTWNPTTSVAFGTGSFTASANPVGSGSGTISYAVSNAGTTGCTVNSSTGLISYTNSGSCSITATAASTATFGSGSKTVTFVIAAAAAAPTVTTTGTSTTSLLLSWNAPTVTATSGSITGYQILYSTASDMSGAVTVNTGNTNTTRLFTGLSSGTTYYFQVRAVSGVAWTGEFNSAVTGTAKASSTTITVVASGGGTLGTDYRISNGVLFTTNATANVNVADIQSALLTGGLTLVAENIVLNSAITWSTSQTLTLGTSGAGSLQINETITASGVSAGLVIAPTSYSLKTQTGAQIILSGGSSTLSIGGLGYTLIRSTADLASVTTTGNYALTKTIAFSGTIATSPINLTFTGTFDGLGNTVDLMRIRPVADGSYGFFSYLNGAAVRNLGLTQAWTSVPTNVNLTKISSGILAGESAGSTLLTQVWSTGHNEVVRGTISRYTLGGLVGNATSGTLTVTKSWSAVSLNSNGATISSIAVGGILGTTSAVVGDGPSLAGGSVVFEQVYTTGNIYWMTGPGHRGYGGLIGLPYSTGSVTITDAFSWSPMRNVDSNYGGLLGTQGNGTVTMTRAYTTSPSATWSGGTLSSVSANVTLGANVVNLNTANWSASGTSKLVNLPDPFRPAYVAVLAPTDGSYSTMSYNLIDGLWTTGLASLNVTATGTPTYTIAPDVANGTYSVDYVSGLTLAGSNAPYYKLMSWPNSTSVTISKQNQTVTWTPTTSVNFGSGTFTPSSAPVASGGTTISYAVTSAGTTGCTVNSTTGAVTYTRSGSCSVTATAAGTTSYFSASATVTFVIDEPATAPTVSAATAGNGVLNIGWTAPTVTSSAALTGYTLTYSTNSGMASPTTVNVGNTRGYLLTGLTSGTTYYFQVRAVSGATWTGPLSAIASATANSTATTINVVASGGGTAGTDFKINGGVISATGTVSINESDIESVLATEGIVQLAATTVNVNAPITWSSNAVLVLGNTSTATVNVNSQITGSGATAGVRILPTTYGLEVKSGAYIRLTGATPSFNLGGTAYTVVNTVAGLSSVTASSTWAVTAPILLTDVYTSSLLNMNFAGTMDGLGNTISNMQIVATAVVNSGFYNNLQGATVRNIGFTNVNIRATTGGATTRLGAVAGNGSTGGTNTVTQVWATGFINQTSSDTGTKTEVGGLFGGATTGTLNISKSWSSVAISTKAPSVGSGGIIGTNVSTFGGDPGSGNTLTISESYSTGNILRDLTTAAWYGNAGIIGVSYGLSTTITNTFSWGNINSTGVNAGTSTAGISGVGTATISNSYTTHPSCGGTATNCRTGQTAGVAVSGGTGFTSGVWQSVNGTSLTNLALPTKNLYVKVFAPTDGSYGTISYEIVDSTGTTQTLSSLNLSVTGTPVYTITSSTAKGTYPNVAYVSGLTLGGSSASVYSLSAWITNTSVTISKFPQTVTWSPTTSYAFGNGTITPSVAPVASGGTAITYAVTSAGTTGCVVNSSTGVITYLTAGTCEVTATAANAGDYLSASKTVSFVITAAPNFTIVSSGGGVAGTDYTLANGIITASANTSINVADLTAMLANGSVQLAGSVVVDVPITWSANTALTLGGTTANTVTINKSITASGNTAGVVIRPVAYGLTTKDEAAIVLSGTTPTLSIGGNTYTLIKSIAELSSVTATAGTFWALAKPLTFSTTIDRPAINVAFAGTFDGLGNTVDNMRLTSTANLGAAFIKNLKGGTVRNLGITNSLISLQPTVTTNTLNAGGLVGDSDGGTLDQVWTTGFMQVKAGSTYVGLTMGGLVGDVYSGTMNITKSWSALNINGWGSTYTNLAVGGIVGGNFGTWSATATTAGGTVNISQVYSLGDLANPNTTGSLSGTGGIMGIHTGPGSVSIVDTFSWSQLSVNSGSKYGGIIGIGNGGTITLSNYRTISNQDYTSTGTSTRYITNGFINASFGGTNATLEALPNWYASTKGTALRNLPVPYKNFYVRVISPTDGSYGTLSYSMVNGVAAPVTLSAFNLTATGTPTYSIASNAAISTTPYLVDYVSGLTFNYSGSLPNVYRFAAYSNATSVTISKYSQTISLTSSAPATATVGSTYTIEGSASSGLTVVYTIDSTSSSICSISGSVVTYNALGTCTINANQAGSSSYLAAPQVQQVTAVDTKGTQSVSFDSTAPANPVVGETYTPTVSSTSGLTPALTVASGSSAICVIASGVVSFTAAGDCVLNLNQAGNANWNAATQVVETITVGKASQLITFTSEIPDSAVVGGATYTVATTGGASQNARTYSIVDTSVCSISGAEVTFLAAGSCVIKANQAGNENYLAAPEVSQTIAVGAGTQAITFTSTIPADAVVGGSTYTVSATGGPSGNAVTFQVANDSADICSISSRVVTFTAVGECVIEANQAGNSSWNAATVATQTIAVGKGTQVILFTSTAPTNAVVDGPTYTILASGGLSREPVVFTVASGSVTSCSISSNVVSFIGAGDCLIEANQAGNLNWNEATQVTQTITVGKGSQVVSFSSDAPTGVRVGDSGYFPSATGGASTSGVTISVAASSSVICEITNGSVSFNAVGSCVLELNQAGDSNYEAALRVTQTITVAKGLQTITKTSIDPVAAVVGGESYTPSFTGGPSGNLVEIEIASASALICTETAGTINFIGAGDCDYTLNQAGTANYEAATEQSYTIAVSKGSQTISWISEKPTSAEVGGSTYTPSASGGASGSAVSFRIDLNTASVCAITAGVVRFVGVGTCTVLANQSGNNNYLAAAQESQSFSVGKGTQTISFTSTAPAAVVNGSTYTPTATGGATGNAVTFQVAAASSAICALTFGRIAFHAVGDCVIEANQLGNTNYQAASQVTQTVTVGKGIQTISFTSSAPSAKVGGATYTPLVTGGASGNAVAVSIAPTSTAICSVANGVVSFQAVGSCVVEANQAASVDFEAATVQTQTISVGKGTQVLNFTSTPPSLRPVQGTTYTPTATFGNSGEPVAFSIGTEAAGLCTIANGVISFLAVGDCVLHADQAGNANYNAATRITQIFDITKGEQIVTITSTAPTDAVVDGANYIPSGTGGNGTKPIVFSASAESAGICSVIEGAVYFDGAGECVIALNQAGDSNYNAATQKLQSISVGKGSQSITFTSTYTSATVDGAAYTPTFDDGESINPVHIAVASSSSLICEVSGGSVSFHAVGDCVIEATQAGDNNYEAARLVSQTIAVAKGAQAPLVGRSSLTTLTLGTSTPTAVLNTSGGSGTGALTWSVLETSNSVCVVSGEIVYGLATGYCDLVATKAGDDNYLEASANLTVVVSTGGQTPVRTSVSNSNPTYSEGLSLTLSLAGGNGDGQIWFESLTTHVCNTDGTNSLNIYHAGVCIVVGHKDGDENFASVEDTLTFTIEKATQTGSSIKLGNALTYSTSGAVTTTLSIDNARTSGAQSFSVTSGSCTIENNELSATQAGDCEISATVSGDDRYLDATFTETFTVAKAPQLPIDVTLATNAPAAISWAGVKVTTFNVGGGSGATEFTATSNTPLICSAELSGSVLTVTGLAQGTCGLSVNNAASDNFLAATTMLEVDVLDLAAVPTSVAIATPTRQQDGSLTSTISWVAPVASETSAAVTGFKVQSSIDNGTTWTDVANGAVDKDTTSLSITLAPWSKYNFRVAAKSALDGESLDATALNWAYFDLSGDDTPDQLAVGGGSVVLSTTKAATTSGEVVYVTGVGFLDAGITSVEITTPKAVFTSSLRAAALVTTKIVPATVISDTKLSFVLPKITLPKGVTTLRASVKVLNDEQLRSDPIPLDYIPKKLSQVLTATLPSATSIITMGTPLVSLGTITSNNPTNPPVVTASPASVCTASLNVLNKLEIVPVAPGKCLISVVVPSTPAYTATAAKTATYSVKAHRTSGLSLSADAVAADDTRTPTTFDVTSQLANTTINVFVGENPLEIPVTLNKREGSVLFTVDAASETASRCAADSGDMAGLVGSITINAPGICKVTVTIPIDANYHAGTEVIVITVNAIELTPEQQAGKAPDNGVASPITDTAELAEILDPKDPDDPLTPPVSIELDPTRAADYAFGGEDGLGFDPATGKLNVRSRTPLVGTWTATLTGIWTNKLDANNKPKMWFKIPGKIVKKVQTYTYSNVCKLSLTVKKDPKLKKKVTRLVGAGCILSDAGKAALTEVGIQKIKVKYKRVRQYAKTGLSYVKVKGNRVLKNINRTWVVKIGRRG